MLAGNFGYRLGVSPGALASRRATRRLGSRLYDSIASWEDLGWTIEKLSGLGRVSCRTAPHRMRYGGSLPLRGSVRTGTRSRLNEARHHSRLKRKWFSVERSMWHWSRQLDQPYSRHDSSSLKRVP